MKLTENTNLHMYQIAVIASVLFTLVGFSYNVWRMEVSEENNNIRTACFEMLLELSSLEQLVYAAHYDKDTESGNPREGWVKVGLITDLSALTTPTVKNKATLLNTTWSEHWDSMVHSKQSTDAIVSAIDMVRTVIKQNLSSLE